MQGQLFTQDFLIRGIAETPPHQELSDTVFDAFCAALRIIFQGLDGASTINEAQTEQVVINKVLAALRWAGAMTFCRRSMLTPKAVKPCPTACCLPRLKKRPPRW